MKGMKKSREQLMNRHVITTTIKALRSIQIHTRLIVSFLMLSLMPLLIIGYMTYTHSSEDIKTKIESYSTQLMGEASKNLETELKHLESICEELVMTDVIQKELSQYKGVDVSNRYQISDDITQKFVEKMRLSSFKASSDITSINILVDENTVLGSGQNNYQYSQLSALYKEVVTHENRKYHYDILTDLNGEFEIAIDMLVTNHVSGEVIGVLILTFKAAYVSEICESLALGDGSQIFILNDEGIVITSNNQKEIPSGGRFYDPHMWMKLQDNIATNFRSFPITLKNEKQLAVYGQVQEPGWTIIGTIPYAYIQAESRQLMKNIAFISLLCIFLAIPMIFIISYSISTPLLKLKVVMSQAKNGILDVYIQDEDSDEISEMADCFNEMMGGIKNLVQENLNTQKEIVYKLGEVIEVRSQETGNHIKRVANYTKLLALKMGIAEEEAELIKMASTLHDIGKVSVPDSILLKPGKLTREEFEIMKKHTTVGHDILVNSNKKILRVAAEISLEHHEKFDGTGYPKGLLGQEISLKSRIIALVDVFDALGTDRVYKKKWALPEILAYLEEQRGKHFDPQILDMFFKSMDEIIEIRDRLED